MKLRKILLGDNMSSDALWNEFEKTGKIEDYMKYKLNETKNEEVNETFKSEGNSNKGDSV